MDHHDPRETLSFVLIGTLHISTLIFCGIIQNSICWADILKLSKTKVKLLQIISLLQSINK